MKKHIFTLASLLALETLSAQVRTVNSATNVSVTNSPAFIDASSNTTVNGSANVGKGLIFPRVDLSAMTAFPGVTAGIANSFPTRFDGMIVYNTASSGTAGVGSTQGTLSPGYWYYENKSSSNTGGTWKPMGASVEPWYNAATNTAATGNTQDIYQMGKVGVGTATPGSSLDVKGSLAAQYNAVTATSYAMTATDYHVSYNGTANAAFTLPAAVAGAGNFKGRMYTIKNNTAFTITITPAGSETINGTPSLTLAANQSVQMINTGLTGAAATWEVLGYNSTSATGTTCVPDYIFVRPKSALVLPASTDVIFKDILTQVNIPYNATTGVFTLSGGKTYELIGGLYGTNSLTSGYTEFVWVDAVTNTPLTTSSWGGIETASSTREVQSISNAIAIYTPTTDVTVKLRTTLSCVGSMTTGIGGPYAYIKQLNACGGNGGSSSIPVTASNGLTASSNNVKLGGTLSQTTDIATAGNNLTISGTGNVGIGNTAPTSKVDIVGDTKIIPSTISSIPAVGLLRLGNSDYSTQTNKTLLSLAPGVFSVDAPGIVGGRFIVDGSGNVGIGNSTPSAKFDINGNLKITDGTQGAGKVLTSDSNGLASWNFPPIKYASISSYTPQDITTVNTWVNTGVSITVPESGLYYINFNARAWMGAGAVNGDFWRAQLRINNTTVAGTVFGMHASIPGNNADTTSSFSSVMSLSKNDTLTLWYIGTNSFTALGNGDGGSSITAFRLGN